MAAATVIAIGGGGFSTGTDEGLDALVLARLAGTGRRVGFVGTASGDDPERLARFRLRIAPRVASATTLPLAADARAAAAWVAGLDLIYVGGGDTDRLLDHWRVAGIDRVLADAARAGVVLAGVSAGAICWFDCALARRADGALARIDGLGLVAGSCCAHYAEAERRSAYPARIVTGTLPAGIAIDDGVAVVLGGDAPPRAWSARAGAWAYALSVASSGAPAIAPLANLVNG